MRKPILLIAMAVAVASKAQIVDFDKIQSWTGEGDCRAALLVTDNASASDPHVYVWGYRWPAGETRTGDDMFKAICAGNDNLVLLTQRTGQYGSTVCGIGYGDAEGLLANIYYDFDAALNSEFINFDYYSTNVFFGQKEAPGDNTPEICAEAVALAIENGSHVIQHPLDYVAYGYPAYDYDCWELTDEGHEKGWWTAAWYEGYWSYWTAGARDEEWMYSGTGFTGRQLSDGCADAWSFTLFDEPKVGGIGEGSAPSEDASLYVYPSKGTSSAIGVEAKECDAPAEYFNLAGQRIEGSNLAKGIYVMRQGDSVKKIYIR